MRKRTRRGAVFVVSPAFNGLSQACIPCWRVLAQTDIGAYIADKGLPVTEVLDALQEQYRCVLPFACRRS